MRQTFIGKLPEGFGHLARFRPADQLDFSRRCKNMAKVLLRPLQEMQSLLARAYGYADVHELQQALRVEAAPGPYQDHLSQLSSDATFAYELRFYRDGRLMRFLSDGSDEISDEAFGRQSLACDLGLFSSPTAHRAAVKCAVAFIETQSGFNLDGFPFGFNGVLHSRYRFTDFEIDAATREQFKVAAQSLFLNNVPFIPDEQLNLLRRHRASFIFVEMAKRSMPSAFIDPPAIEINFEYHCDEWCTDEAVALLQGNFDYDIERHLVRRYEDSQGDEYIASPAEEAGLELAISSPTAENIQACVITREMPDLQSRLVEWRFSLRLQWAQAYVSGELDEYFDFPAVPRVLTSGGGLAVAFTWMVAVDTDYSFEHWKMGGSLLRKENADGPWQLAGIFSGDYVIPYSENGFCPPDQLIRHLDDYGRELLSCAWKILDSKYIQRAGYENYHEWVNDSEGSAMVLLRYWTPSDERKEMSENFLLETVVETFQDGYSDSWDSGWQAFGMPNEREIDVFDFDEPVYEFPAVGVVFLPRPGEGVLGFSVWASDEDAATTQLLRVGGERLGRGSGRSMYGRQARTGPGWDMLERLKKFKADFVIFDPSEDLESS